jgi:hypothetical protein
MIILQSGAGDSAQADGDAASANAATAEPAPVAEAAEGGDPAAADTAPADAVAAKAVSDPQPSGQVGTPAKNGRGGANGRERRPKVDVQRIAEVRQQYRRATMRHAHPNVLCQVPSSSTAPSWTLQRA